MFNTKSLSHKHILISHSERKEKALFKKSVYISHFEEDPASLAKYDSLSFYIIPYLNRLKFNN